MVSLWIIIYFHQKFYYTLTRISKFKSLCVWGSQNLSSDKYVPRYSNTSKRLTISLGQRLSISLGQRPAVCPVCQNPQMIITYTPTTLKGDIMARLYNESLSLNLGLNTRLTNSICITGG